MLVSTATAEAMLDTVISGDVVVSLHTANPGSNGANEIAGGHRVTIEDDEWQEYVTIGGARVARNSEEEEFTDSATATQAITHFTIWRADGTTFVLSNALTNPQTVQASNPIRFPPGSFTFGLRIAPA